MALVNLIHWTSLKMICFKLQENTSPIFCCTIISIFLPSFSDQFWPTPSIEIALFLPVYYFAFFSRIFKEYLMCVWERKRERWYCCISLVVFLCVIKCIMGEKYVWPQVFLLKRIDLCDLHFAYGMELLWLEPRFHISMYVYIGSVALLWHNAKVLALLKVKYKIH